MSEKSYTFIDCEDGYFQIWSRIISSTNFNAQFSLFINNMFVTLLSSNNMSVTQIVY